MDLSRELNGTMDIEEDEYGTHHGTSIVPWIHHKPASQYFNDVIDPLCITMHALLCITMDPSWTKYVYLQRTMDSSRNLHVYQGSIMSTSWYHPGTSTVPWIHHGTNTVGTSNVYQWFITGPLQCYGSIIDWSHFPGSITDLQRYAHRETHSSRVLEAGSESFPVSVSLWRHSIASLSMDRSWTRFELLNYLQSSSLDLAPLSFTRDACSGTPASMSCIFCSFERSILYIVSGNRRHTDSAHRCSFCNTQVQTTYIIMIVLRLTRPLASVFSTWETLFEMNGTK